MSQFWRDIRRSLRSLMKRPALRVVAYSVKHACVTAASRRDTHRAGAYTTEKYQKEYGATGSARIAALPRYDDFQSGPKKETSFHCGEETRRATRLSTYKKATILQDVTAPLLLTNAWRT
jgi:hypothetical protein